MRVPNGIKVQYLLETIYIVAPILYKFLEEQKFSGILTSSRILVLFHFGATKYISALFFRKKYLSMRSMVVIICCGIAVYACGSLSINWRFRGACCVTSFGERWCSAQHWRTEWALLVASATRVTCTISGRKACHATR